MVLENELPLLEDQIKKGDQFSRDHMRELVHCLYGEPMVDRLNNLEWKAHEVRMTVHVKGNSINNLQFELYKLKNEKAGLPRLF